MRLVCPYTTCSCVRGISPGCDPSEQCPVPGLPWGSQQPCPRCCSRRQLPAQGRGAAGGWLHSTHISPPESEAGFRGLPPAAQAPTASPSPLPAPELAQSVRAYAAAYQLCSSLLGFLRFSSNKNSREEKQKSTLVKPPYHGNMQRLRRSGHAWGNKQHPGSRESWVNVLAAAAC